jgi:CBS domain-containing protein
MRTVASILSITDSALCTVEATVSVCEAVHSMSQLQVDSLLVVDDQGVVGIFTEHDVLLGVVAAERDPHGLTVADVMTCEMATIPPSASLEEAMQVMTDSCHRELLVADDGEICGIVSIGDVTTSLVSERDATIGDLTYYITHG